MIVDLTHPILSGMPVYPGDVIPSFTKRTGYDREGYLVHDLHMGTHTGTHIDSPLHYFSGHTSVDHAHVLAACVGPALVIDSPDAAQSGEITLDGLKDQLEGIESGSRILISTGWSEHNGSPEFFSDFPSISHELAEWLVERHVSLLGIEQPSLHRRDSDTLHRMLLSAGIVIVENLANLKTIAGKNVFFSAAPLPLSGLDGSPVRAYAILE